MNPRVLIVGASHAGVQLASALRSKGYEGAITLAGAENALPYHRPPMSKDYLDGSVGAASLALRPPTFYESMDIDLELRARITEIDTGLGQARTSAGAVFDFDQLALAPGARARRLDVEGEDLNGVVYLRSIRDADRLKVAMSDARRAVVVGGGFIGLETAAVLTQRGLEVTVIEASDRLMGRAVTPTLSTWFSELHEKHGVRVRCGHAVAAVHGTGTVSSVELDDGSSVAADLVVVGVGVEPRDELALQLGLRVDRGIVVDRRSRTSNLDVVAVGDATVLPHPLDPDTFVRLESVQNATDQSQVAAATLLGMDAEYSAVPWFWSDQYDIKLQMVGAPNQVDDLVTRGSAATGSFSLLAYSRGRLVGAECVNAAADFVAVRRALAAGTSFPPGQASDPAVRLKSLL